jgi:hypothetical protein
MTANRLARPSSKLACYEHWLADEVYWPEAKALALEHLYRALDFLLRHIESLEQEIFFRTADLFNADGLCCINRPEAALPPCIPLSADRRGLRPTQFPHPIEQSARDRRFPLLRLVPLCP